MYTKQENGQTFKMVAIVLALRKDWTRIYINLTIKQHCSVEDQRHDITDIKTECV